MENNQNDLLNNNRTQPKAERMKLFLTARAQGYSVAFSARCAGISRRTAYYWRDSDAHFAKKWDEAKEEGTDWYEDCLRGAAFEGNVTAIMAALNARRPGEYQHPSKRVEISGVIKHGVHDLSRYTDDQLDRLIELAERYKGGTGETPLSELL